MKRIVSFILSVAVIAAIPVTASAWVPWGRTVRFYVRLDGTQVDTNGNVASYSTAKYTDLVATSRLNARYDASFTVATGDGVTEDDVLSYLESIPADSTVLSNIAEQTINEGYLKDSNGNVVPWSKLTTDYYAIDWYVLKYESDSTWHIDGNLIDLSTNDMVEIYMPDDTSDIPIDSYIPDYADEPVELESDYAYIFGRNDTAMEAEDGMKRGEAAAVLYRLLKQNDKLGSFSYDQSSTPVFSDTEGRWDRSALEYMHSIGVYADAETIDPDQYITRGEAFKMLAMALGFTDDASLLTEQYAAILVDKGYVDGYGNDNGTLTVADLELSNNINRAEFCKIYNLIINRTDSTVSLETEDGEAVTAETYGFADLDSDKWYYDDMLMATSAFTDGYVDIAARGIRNVLDDYN